MNKILLMAFTASVMLGACKKDSDSPKEKSCTVESFTKHQDGKLEYSYTPTFDSNGRLTKLVGISTSQTYTIELFPQSDKITVSRTANDSPDNSTSTVFTLDSKGRVSSYLDPDDELPVNLEYNSEGYLSKRTLVGSGSNSDSETSTYTYTDGNLTKIETSRTWGSGETETRTTIISYNSDEINNPTVYGYTFEGLTEVFETDLFCVQEFLGNASKNTIKRIEETTHYSFGDEYSEATSFTYEKDAKGNIIGIKKVSESGSYQDNDELKLNYKCD